MTDIAQLLNETERAHAEGRKRVMKLAFELGRSLDEEDDRRLLAELKATVSEIVAQGELDNVIRAEALRAEKNRIGKEITQANLESAKAKSEMLRVEAMKAKGKTRALVQHAVLTGMITPINETPTERAVNRQRRSNGGIIRLESGDGK